VPRFCLVHPTAAVTFAGVLPTTTRTTNAAFARVAVGAKFHGSLPCSAAAAKMFCPGTDGCGLLQEVEIAQLTDSSEKWRQLYASETLPFGSLWKDAERVDPAEARLYPEGTAPEWACNPQEVEPSTPTALPQTTQ
jgi:hypothetical protein